MNPFLESIKEKARKNPKRILFPESDDPRILKAIGDILKEGTALPILLGNRDEVEKNAGDIILDWNRVSVIDPENNPCLENFETLYPDLADLTNNRNVFATVMLKEGLVDGVITGATCSTGDTIRPALRIVGTKEKFHKVSGFFFMIMEKRVMLFADCAVIPEPDAHELADIAIDTAETAKRFGLEPRIAMLSFSTNGSAKHPSPDKVREATKMVRARRPDLIVEGEMQVDAALVPEICRMKFPNATVHEGFNVLIFPNLDAGNIAYKLVQRLAGAHAIGPVYQGLNRPVNDLSRGCSVQDIVELAAFTSVDAQGEDQILIPPPTS